MGGELGTLLFSLYHKSILIIQWALGQNQAAINGYNALFAGTDLLSFMLSTRPFLSWLLYMLFVHAERCSCFHGE